MKFNTIFKNFIHELKGNYHILFVLSIFSFASVIFSLVVSVLNKIIIDRVFHNKQIDFLFHNMIYVLIAVYVFSMVFNLANNYFTAKLYSKIDSMFKIKYYDKIINASYYFHNEHEPSDIYYRMFSDTTVVVKYFLDILINVPTKISFLILALLIMSFWSKLLTVIYVTILICNILMVKLIRKANHSISKHQKEIEQDIIGKVMENISRVSTIKIFRLESFSLNKMISNFREYMRANVHNNFLLSFLSILNNLSTQIWSLLLIVIGAIQVYNNSLSIGEFVAFSSIATSTTNFTLGLINYIFSFESIKLSYERYKEYISYENISVGNRPFVFENKLSIKGLKFAYPKSEKLIINNFSFDMSPNGVICIVGANGKGKSTFASLLDRLITPPGNSMYIDETDINEVNYDEYKRNVGYLIQNPIIFSTSIRNNIVLDRTDIKDQDIMELLNKLDMKNLIDNLPQKLETIIGENGYKLSQGNMQKISIARVLLRKYKILILDEPTASLDTKTRNNFKKVIKEYSRNALILIITHDRSEIDLADDIIDLNTAKFD